MEELFSIGKAAEMAGMTTEALRHYDRIGLVKPCSSDPWTGYRSYSRQEIVRLETVRALQCMDLSLREIKRLLEYRDIDQIVAALRRAEKAAEEKIAAIRSAKAKIAKARVFYQSKAEERSGDAEIGVREIPERTILLSDELRFPTVENLYDYHRHFYRQAGVENRDAFAFEDAAGIYTEDGTSRMFAICTKHLPVRGIKRLPAGRYLCADCTEQTCDAVMAELTEAALREYRVAPRFVVKMIVLSGVLQWNYQIQIFLGDGPYAGGNCDDG